LTARAEHFLKGDGLAWNVTATSELWWAKARRAANAVLQGVARQMSGRSKAPFDRDLSLAFDQLILRCEELAAENQRLRDVIANIGLDVSEVCDA
jgi:hypothetical protein